MKPLITIITPEIVLSWGPCEKYRKNNAKLLYKLGNGGITIEQALDLPISDDDKIWLLLRRDIIPEKDYILLGCKYAKRVLHIYEKRYSGDMRPRNLIKIREQYARGKATKKQLDAAFDATAFDATAFDATRVAARAAACNAAREAARAVARAVARAAACDAACNAACNAEQKAQVEILREYFRKGRV